MRRPRGPRYDEAPGSLGRPPTTCAGLADPAYDEAPGSLGRPPTTCAGLADPAYDEAPASLARPPPICPGLAAPAIMTPPAPRAGPPPRGPCPPTSRPWSVPTGAGTRWVFPEGAGGGGGVLGRAKAGGGMLAVKSGAPVVPVYIGGGGRGWPGGQRLFRPAKVTVAFGPPLRFDGGRRAEGHRRTQYETASPAMMAAIARLKDSAATDATRVGVRAARRRPQRAPPRQASPCN